MIQLFTVSSENPSTEHNQFITFYVDGFIGISNHYHTTILHIPNQLSVNCVNAFNCGQHIFIRCKLNTVTIFSGLCLCLQRVIRYSSGIPPVSLWTYLYEACMWGDYSKYVCAYCLTGVPCKTTPMTPTSHQPTPPSIRSIDKKCGAHLQVNDPSLQRGARESSFCTSLSSFLVFCGLGLKLTVTHNLNTICRYIHVV